MSPSRKLAFVGGSLSLATVEDDTYECSSPAQVPNIAADGTEPRTDRDCVQPVTPVVRSG